MKYIKLFESEIKKSFTEWLKDPKKPSVEKEEYIYIFSKSVRKLDTIVDNGEFTTYEILTFIKEETGEDLIQTISSDLDIQYRDINKDSNELDEAFERWLKDYYAPNPKSTGWDHFMSEYLQFVSEIDSKDYEQMMNAFNNQFKNNFEEENEEEYFRLYNLKIADQSELPKIPESYYNTDLNLYFIAKVSRELIDDEINILKNYINNKIDDLIETNEFTTIKRLSNGERLKFYTTVVFERQPGTPLNHENFNVKLVYPKSI